MKCLVVGVFTAAFVLPLGLFSQDKTDFSGTWVMDAARSESAHQGGPVELITLIITQTPSEVRIEKHSDQRNEVATYKFTHPDSTPPETGGVHWNGDKLVVESVRNADGWAARYVETYNLIAKGRELEVETTVAVQHGYTGNRPTDSRKNYPSGRDVYVKRSGP
jgi:hypothetical protein